MGNLIAEKARPKWSQGSLTPDSLRGGSELSSKTKNTSFFPSDSSRKDVTLDQAGSFSSLPSPCKLHIHTPFYTGKEKKKTTGSLPPPAALPRQIHTFAQVEFPQSFLFVFCFVFNGKMYLSLVPLAWLALNCLHFPRAETLGIHNDAQLPHKGFCLPGGGQKLQGFRGLCWRMSWLPPEREPRPQLETEQQWGE